MPGLRVTEIEREHFDERTLELYWRFLAERQAIWLRRSRGMEQPWTADPILQVEFITNTYRILDPGTEYLIDSILSAPASDEAKVFNIMLYRLMGSVPSTHQHIGFIMPDDFTAQGLSERLRELPDDYRIFGDAYRVASYMAEGSDNKIDNVASMFAYIAGGIEETTRRIKSSRRVVEVYKVFETMQGFGDFLSHQIVVDLLYPNFEGAKIVPFTDDEFAKAGPGARKGIWTLMGENIKPANLTIVLEWLRDHQAVEFDRLSLPFAFLAGEDSEPRLMSVCDIQASLCEFHKYYRLWSGDKAVQVRKYDGPHRDVTPRPVHLTDEEVDVLCNTACPTFTFQDSVLSADDVEDSIVGTAWDEGDGPQDGFASDGDKANPVRSRTDFGVEPTVVDAELVGGEPLSLSLTITLNINIKR